MVLDSITEPVGKALIFDKIRPGLRAYVAKAGYQEVPYSMFGMVFYIVSGIFAAIFITLVLPAFSDIGFLQSFVLYFLSAIGILVVLTAVAILIIQFAFSMKISARTKELERILPDYLTLVSTNLKGGMSFERALWDAIKPEFGILAREIGLVSKKVMTGSEVTESLNEFINKYDSPILKRNFQLIVSEVESGGQIVTVIDRVIENLKKTDLLKKELVASTTTYMLFIGALVTVVGPVLFALSFQLFILIQGFMGGMDATPTTGQLAAIQLSAPDIDPADFRLFSVLAIVVISIGSACITSVIERGDLSGTLRYAPTYIIVALSLYFLSSFILEGIFSNIIM